MSSLRERIEGLVAKWRAAADDKELVMVAGFKQVEMATICADELAAALAADGPWLDPKSLGIPLQHEPSAAPSLHKEGAESRSVQRRVALQKGEKMPTFSGAGGDADCRAVLTKEGDRCALEARHGGAHQLKIPGTKETKP